ncbi:uncharacterized protein F5Z01DRAFT_633151 [Emericellopsis atlantica]|uniref:CPAF-like PDZ domain-containing protein n=1 Tax=Emericellopsis atlantica TaxID=2614577 RepID=A0A9P7ZUT3_9HYPO|nr:uncharacterized protein F5Z01DRAFT_633151 [Emericellopsis atlantica]KAG9258152.1 hypothetical protein F5Z01DRAFT_633151 [Emericellopsis atlantica]
MFDTSPSKGRYLFPIANATECLRQLKYDKQRGRAFLQELPKYLQFHSTLDLLRDTPESPRETSDWHNRPSVDILGELESMQDEDFTDQWQFDRRVYSVIRHARDSHLELSLCSMDIFRFHVMSNGLVSVSDNGTSLPEVYFVDDIEALEEGQTQISPIARINGEDVRIFLERLDSPVPVRQDPDAHYNSLFFSFASEAASWPLKGQLVHLGRFEFGAESLHFEFHNGSTTALPIVASVISPGQFLVDGLDSQTLYRNKCLPDDPSPIPDPPQEPEVDRIEQEALSPIDGHPEPSFLDNNDQPISYNLDHDTVILHIPVFSHIFIDPSYRTADAMADYVNIISLALDEGRTKLIIDITGNTGGDAMRAYYLFKLLFPDKVPYTACRVRRSKALDMITYAGQLGNKSEFDHASLLQYLNYPHLATPDLEEGFADIGAFLGGENAPFSSPYSPFSYSSPAYNGPHRDKVLQLQEIIGRLHGVTPFDPANILIVGDGNCDSACAKFVDLMVNVAGVKSLVFGGAPHREPMQIIGGTRGGKLMKFPWIELDVSISLSLLGAARGPSDVQESRDNLPVPLDRLPLKLGNGVSCINLENVYHRVDEEVPLQFKYQPADCRLFFTAENILDPATRWTAAKNARWGDGSCVAGTPNFTLPQPSTTLLSNRHHPSTRSKDTRPAAAGLQSRRAGIRRGTNRTDYEHMPNDTRTVLDSVQGHPQRTDSGQGPEVRKNGPGVVSTWVWVVLAVTGAFLLVTMSAMRIAKVLNGGDAW